MDSKHATLERNWRRVASTHTLEEASMRAGGELTVAMNSAMQDLMNADQYPAEGGPSMKLLLAGVGLVAAGVICIGMGVLSFGAPWLPALGRQHPWLQALHMDRYYHLLVPAMVPVTIFAIFVNWFSMKLFRHNS